MKKIKVGIDGGDFVLGTQISSGIQRLVEESMKSLARDSAEALKVCYYAFNSNQTVRSLYRTPGVRQTVLTRKFYGSLFLPLNVIKDRCDVFLGFSGQIPRLLDFIGVYKVVFLYDLGFFDSPNLYPDAERLKKQTIQTVKSADKIVVLSDYWRNKIIEKFNLPQKKVVRIYAGMDHFINMKRKATTDINYEYFLYSGAVKKTKNINRLIEVYGKYLDSSSSTTKLVIAGSADPCCLKELQESETYNRYKKFIEFIINPSDSELYELYNKSKAFVNLSFGEGFCFPLFEALSFGKIAVLNNLRLYTEFANYFKNIKICKTDLDVIKNIKKIDIGKGARSKPKIPSEFRWKYFGNRLLNLIKNS